MYIELNFMTTDQPQTQFTQADVDDYNFTDAIVRGITGMAIVEIPEENRSEIITECLDVFKQHVLNYVEIKYGKKDAVRLNAAQKFQTDSFAKFPDLDQKFQEAYQDFINTLESTEIE